MSLYFGSSSLTSKCLSSWITHFEFNRVYYRSLQDADKSFLTQVLFAIDRALQIYWHSCGENEDRWAINSRILQMQDLQNNIERHNFSYILPRVLLDKFTPDVENTNGKEHNGKKLGKKREKQEQENLKKKQRIEDNHKQWHLKPNENFFELFWKNTAHCPKTKNGNIICMKFFVKGFCNKTCNRAHKLSAEEEKEFDEFEHSSLKLTSLPRELTMKSTTIISSGSRTMHLPPLQNPTQLNCNDKQDTVKRPNKVTQKASLKPLSIPTKLHPPKPNFGSHVPTSHLNHFEGKHHSLVPNLSPQTTFLYDKIISSPNTTESQIVQQPNPTQGTEIQLIPFLYFLPHFIFKRCTRFVQ